MKSQISGYCWKAIDLITSVLNCTFNIQLFSSIISLLVRKSIIYSEYLYKNKFLHLYKNNLTVIPNLLPLHCNSLVIISYYYYSLIIIITEKEEEEILFFVGHILVHRPLIILYYF